MGDTVLARQCALAIVRNEEEKVDDDSSAATVRNWQVWTLFILGGWCRWWASAQGVDIDKSWRFATLVSECEFEYW